MNMRPGIDNDGAFPGPSPLEDRSGGILLLAAPQDATSHIPAPP